MATSCGSIGKKENNKRKEKRWLIYTRYTPLVIVPFLQSWPVLLFFCPLCHSWLSAHTTRLVWRILKALFIFASVSRLELRLVVLVHGFRVGVAVSAGVTLQFGFAFGLVWFFVFFFGRFDWHPCFSLRYTDRSNFVRPSCCLFLFGRRALSLSLSLSL